jgi:hypothetical protein
VTRYKTGWGGCDFWKGTTLADAAKVQRAVQAYLYGYPLVYNLDEVAKFPAAESTILPGQWSNSRNWPRRS